MDRYDFYKTKYGQELLIDLIRLEDLEKYIINDTSHALSYYDITIITGGDGTFLLDEYSFRIKPNMLFFTSPMQVRQWKIKNVPKGLVLIFEEEFLDTFFNDAEFVQRLSYFNTTTHKPALSLNTSDFIYLKTILKNIEEEIIAQEKKDYHILRALLYQVLVWLNRQYLKRNSGSNPVPNRYVFEFRKLVNQHFLNQHSVSFYAENLTITPGHLNDVVKQYFGVSPKEFIQDRVFLEAKRLLLYSSLSVSEIAWKLNFPDDSYFVKAFKNKVGCTPLSYKKTANP